jgi:periplasmic divalent cation tolerance protein
MWNERAEKMSSAKSYSIVLVTTPDLRTARMLAKAALNKHLVACANLIPKLESHYWWRGKIETGAEVLMLLKTSSSKLSALEKLILAEHPYDTPEFIAVTIKRGNKRYLNWLANSLA